MPVPYFGSTVKQNTNPVQHTHRLEYFTGSGKRIEKVARLEEVPVRVNENKDYVRNRIQNYKSKFRKHEAPFEQIRDGPKGNYGFHNPYRPEIRQDLQRNSLKFDGLRSGGYSLSKTRAPLSKQTKFGSTVKIDTRFIKGMDNSKFKGPFNKYKFTRDADKTIEKHYNHGVGNVMKKNLGFKNQVSTDRTLERPSATGVFFNPSENVVAKGLQFTKDSGSAKKFIEHNNKTPFNSNTKPKIGKLTLENHHIKNPRMFVNKFSVKQNTVSKDFTNKENLIVKGRLGPKNTIEQKQFPLGSLTTGKKALNVIRPNNKRSIQNDDKNIKFTTNRTLGPITTRRNVPSSSKVTRLPIKVTDKNHYEVLK